MRRYAATWMVEFEAEDRDGALAEHARLIDQSEAIDAEISLGVIRLLPEGGDRG